jgi:hypothetical protein
MGLMYLGSFMIYICKLAGIEKVRHKNIILICILIMGSCSSTKEDHFEGNHFEGTTRVETYGDSLRIEFEEKGNITINHLMHLDSSGNVTFINETVSLDNRVDQLKEGLQYGYGIYKIGDYEIRFPKVNQMIDTNAIINNFLRTGKFTCYLNSSPQTEAFVLERILEGNGTYRNKLFLIEPNKGDTIRFFNFYDCWLPLSNSWEWKDLKPMTWEKYLEKRKTT